MIIFCGLLGSNKVLEVNPSKDFPNSQEGGILLATSVGQERETNHSPQDASIICCTGPRGSNASLYIPSRFTTDKMIHVFMQIVYSGFLLIMYIYTYMYTIINPFKMNIL